MELKDKGGEEVTGTEAVTEPVTQKRGREKGEIKKKEETMGILKEENDPGQQ